jgi:hypothetical protein
MACVCFFLWPLLFLPVRTAVNLIENQRDGQVGLLLQLGSQRYRGHVFEMNMRQCTISS